MFHTKAPLALLILVGLTITAHASSQAPALGLVASKPAVSAKVKEAYPACAATKSLVLSGKKRFHPICYAGPVWVPGHFELVERRVWIPATRKKVWIRPSYKIRYDACGRGFKTHVGGRWTIQTTPGHFETRSERVWVPGRYEKRCGSASC